MHMAVRYGKDLLIMCHMSYILDIDAVSQLREAISHWVWRNMGAKDVVV
jgi:DNA-binding LytR/AlgR family response regulator